MFQSHGITDDYHHSSTSRDSRYLQLPTNMFWMNLICEEHGDAIDMVVHWKSRQTCATCTSSIDSQTIFTQKFCLSHLVKFPATPGSNSSRHCRCIPAQHTVTNREERISSAQAGWLFSENWYIALKYNDSDTGLCVPSTGAKQNRLAIQFIVDIIINEHSGRVRFVAVSTGCIRSFSSVLDNVACSREIKLWLIQ